MSEDTYGERGGDDVMISRIGLVAASLWPIGAIAAPVHYVCDGGTTLAVTFSTPNVTPGRADLAFGKGGQRLRLPQVLSADGGRYANGATEFWIKGETATLTQHGSALDCRSVSR